MASFSTLSTKPHPSKKACSSSSSLLTLMRLPVELRFIIYDYVWEEDITIDLTCFEQPLLGGRYHQVRGGIRPQRLVYNSLQLVQKGRGGLRGDLTSIAALRVCREFWREGLRRGRFHIDGYLDNLQTFLGVESSEPYFRLVRRLTLCHMAWDTDPYHQLSDGIHQAANIFCNLRELGLLIDSEAYSNACLCAIGLAVRGIVDCFPNKKPLLTVRITDAANASDDQAYAHCSIRGLDPFTKTPLRDSEYLFQVNSAKCFPQLRQVSIYTYTGECERDVIQRYEYKGWRFEGSLVTTRTGVGDTSLWSDIFVRRLHEPIWVYTLKKI